MMAIESTLAIVKPDAYAHSADILLVARRAGFDIAARLDTTLSPSQAETFYSEHAHKSFYSDLVEFMTSGPVTVAVLRKNDAITAWRSALGPTNPLDAKKEAPQCIRARFGTDITHNAAHGSDSAESASKEIAFFFPDFEAPTARTGADAKAYLNDAVCPLLTRALTDMCGINPERPVEWLAHYLMGQVTPLPAMTAAPAVANGTAAVVQANGTAAAPEANGKEPGRRIFFVLGGPGSGKGTQCKRIVDKYGYAHFSAGDLLRAEVKSGSEQGEMIDEMIKEGKIVPGEITIELLKKAIEGSDAPGVLIDGFPRKLAQAGAFEKDVSDFEFVLFLDCPEEVMEDRLLKRGETSGRSDDNAESIRKRFRTFVETSMPVVEYYEAKGKVHRINATESMDEVFAKVDALF